MHLIEVQERKRQLLKARAELQSKPASTDKSDLLSAWDDEDEKADIPDEIQARLLPSVLHIPYAAYLARQISYQYRCRHFHVRELKFCMDVAQCLVIRHLNFQLYISARN